MIVKFPVKELIEEINTNNFISYELWAGELSATFILYPDTLPYKGADIKVNVRTFFLSTVVRVNQEDMPISFLEGFAVRSAIRKRYNRYVAEQKQESENRARKTLEDYFRK